MIENLKSLRGARAPSDFLENVLRTVGLVDAYAVVERDGCPVFVAQSSKGITLVRRAQQLPLEFEREYAKRFGRRIELRENLATELTGAIAGGARVPVDLRGASDFQRAVLKATRAIGPGYVRSYSWIAEHIGRSKAVRAVGTALATNPVPLVIPCHRIVRADGTTGDYIFGADEKIALLEREGANLSRLHELAARDTRFLASKTTKVFCYPFCFPASRILPKNLIELTSAREAVARGFRPCKACHPSIAS